MIPPFLLTLGGKVGMGLLGAAVIGGAIYAYNARQQSIGENRVEAKHAEQVQRQTEQVKVVDAKLDDQRLQAVERASAEKDAFNAKLIESNRAYAHVNATLKATLQKERASQPEVIHDVYYIEVPTKEEAPCVVPDRLVDRVDELGRMLNDLSNHRVPVDQATAGQSGSESNGPVACAALVHRIEVLTARLGNTMIDHGELWDYTVKQYETYAAFEKVLTHEAP